MAVEPLAAALGTTKGSFYWHFSGRDALLEAALQLWERTDTEDVIAQVEAAPDPHRRLQAPAHRGDRRSGRQREGAVGSPCRPARTTRWWHRCWPGSPGSGSTTCPRCSRELDFAAPQARRRALLAYTAYLGHAQLAHATPDEAPRGPDLSGYLADVMATLTSR